jgi:hypothetical protein
MFVIARELPDQPFVLKLMRKVKLCLDTQALHSDPAVSIVPNSKSTEPGMLSFMEYGTCDVSWPGIWVAYEAGIQGALAKHIVPLALDMREWSDHDTTDVPPDRTPGSHGCARQEVDRGAKPGDQSGNLSPQLRGKVHRNVGHISALGGQQEHPACPVARLEEAQPASPLG